MTGHTHSLAEWAAFLSLGVSLPAAVSIPFWLTYDAELVDFDPRPAVRHAIESGRMDPLLIAVVAVRSAARDAAHASHEALRDAAALVLLLTTRPKAGLR